MALCILATGDCYSGPVEINANILSIDATLCIHEHNMVYYDSFVI